jgi:hypothetical protein
MPASVPQEIIDLLGEGSIVKVQHDAIDDKTKLHEVSKIYFEERAYCM